MKRFLIGFFILIFCITCPAFALDEVNLEFNENFQKLSINILSPEEMVSQDNQQDEAEREEPMDVEGIDTFNVPLPEIVVSEETAPLTFYSRLQNEIKQTMKDVYKLQIEETDSITPLLKDKLKFHFDRGPISSLHTSVLAQNKFDLFMPNKGNSYSKYDVNLITVIFDAKTRSGKDMFRLMLDPSHQHNVPFMQNLFKDVFYETKRIPHHSILIGNSRAGTGIEGLQSPYIIPFMHRAQISRNFSNIRKVGLRVRGDYKYLDYDFGTYSSGTYFSDFIPGGEFDVWVNAKPLAKSKGKYGKLKTGMGLSTGKRHSTDYFVGSFGLHYSYKKLWTQMEYSFANGSNGYSGLSSKHRQGWYVTLGYKLTKKLEIVARYDDFDPDKSIGRNNTREYSAGINYYIKGQALKLVLDYIFCQNKASSDSHRFLIGAQLAL